MKSKVFTKRTFSLELSEEELRYAGAQLIVDIKCLWISTTSMWDIVFDYRIARKIK